VTLIPGSHTELENLGGDDKGKSTSGEPREAESTEAPVRGGLPRNSDEADVMSVERRGQVTNVGIRSTGNRKSLISGREAAASIGGTSRVTGDGQARFCERLGVKFPGPTRHTMVGLVTEGVTAVGSSEPIVAAAFRTKGLSAGLNHGLAERGSTRCSSSCG
jgi:hypothetical protein